MGTVHSLAFARNCRDVREAMDSIRRRWVGREFGHWTAQGIQLEIQAALLDLSRRGTIKNLPHFRVEVNSFTGMVTIIFGENVVVADQAAPEQAIDLEA